MNLSNLPPEKNELIIFFLPHGGTLGSQKKSSGILNSNILVEAFYDF